MTAAQRAPSRDSQAGPLPVVVLAELPADVRDKLDALEATSDEDDPLFRPLPAIKPATRDPQAPLSTPRRPSKPRSRRTSVLLVGAVMTVAVTAFSFGIGQVAFGDRRTKSAQTTSGIADNLTVPAPPPVSRPSPRVVAAAPSAVAPSSIAVVEASPSPASLAKAKTSVASSKRPTQLEEHRTFGD